MYPQSQNLGNDGESLQTDVMRFMAIIGFCLIAILALVKNVEPAEATAAPAPVPAPETTPEKPPAKPSTMPPAMPTPWKALAEPTPTPAPVELPVVEAVQPVEPAPALEAPQPEPQLEPQQTPEQPVAEPESQLAAETATEDEGLVLRFASDGDFLRLIAKGDIQVYAFQETDVLTLNSSYRFLDTQSPGQVYELLRPSIPGLIVDALKQARRDIDGFRWGIALPGRISNQIERHLGQVSRGQLVIDRYGDVHHVAAS